MTSLVRPGALAAMSGPVRKERKLCYAGTRMTCEDIENLPEMREEKNDYEEVDFSSAHLSSRELRKVLDICYRCRNLRVLRLYKNKIDDEGAADLAEFCAKRPGIEQIHMSHNLITAIGIEKLVTSAESSRKKDQYPLWLRVEHNMVENPEKVFRELEERLKVCQRPDERRCTPQECAHGMLVHLPHFRLQKGEKGEKGGGKGKRDKKRGRHGKGHHKGYGDDRDYDYRDDNYGYRDDNGYGSWHDRGGREQAERTKVVLVPARQDAFSRSPERDGRYADPTPQRKRKLHPDECSGSPPPQRHRTEGRRVSGLRHGRCDEEDVVDRHHHRHARGETRHTSRQALGNDGDRRVRTRERAPQGREGEPRRRCCYSGSPVYDRRERLHPSRPDRGTQPRDPRRRAQPRGADRRDDVPTRPQTRHPVDAKRPPARDLENRAVAQPAGKGAHAAPPAMAPEAAGSMSEYSSYSDEEDGPIAHSSAPQTRAVPGMAAAGSLVAAARPPSSVQVQGAPAQAGQVSDDESSATFSADEGAGTAAVPAAPPSPGSSAPASPGIGAANQLYPSPSSDPSIDPYVDPRLDAPDWEQDRGCPPPSPSPSRSPVATAAASSGNKTNQSRMKQLKERLVQKAHKWQAPPV